MRAYREVAGGSGGQLTQRGGEGLRELVRALDVREEHEGVAAPAAAHEGAHGAEQRLESGRVLRVDHVGGEDHLEGGRERRAAVVVTPAQTAQRHAIGERRVHPQRRRRGVQRLIGERHRAGTSGGGSKAHDPSPRAQLRHTHSTHKLRAREELSRQQLAALPHGTTRPAILGSALAAVAGRNPLVVHVLGSTRCAAAGDL
eukprot:CAMPEP_0118817394 /NCGR_PEP_ID=MMETSP1162-20130426/5397_1 /TAXON_ID=33656 /ORGANISM="Phaeocystis Sp, Strain CCMP2710" /LENGTH=200 /DNA_ID=CAMNT_0006747495 /DNA_START=295 /DNA_END=898 /DNA_ORIENTATION=+